MRKEGREEKGLVCDSYAQTEDLYGPLSDHIARAKSYPKGNLRIPPVWQHVENCLVHCWKDAMRSTDIRLAKQSLGMVQST